MGINPHRIHGTGNFTYIYVPFTINWSQMLVKIPCMASGLIKTTLVSEIITSSARLETHVVSLQYFDTETCQILTH